MKTKNKVSLIFSASLLVLSLPIILTSCSLFETNVKNPNKTPWDSNSPNNNDNINNDNSSSLNSPEVMDKMQFISERSFSLKFTSYTSKNIGYGTGWIFAKDNSNIDTYYIATNLHVASFIANSGKSSYQLIRNESLNTYQYRLSTNTTFNEIHFGQMLTNKNGDIYAGTTNANASLQETQYIQKVNINNVSVAYTTFDMFNNMQLFNKFNVYNDEYVKNATQDLAILKVDFSKREYINNFRTKTDVIKKSLDAYDRNPTKFAKNYDYRNDKITIAGFPADKGSGKWTSSINMISNDIFQGLQLDRSLWSAFIEKNLNMDDVKRNYSLLNNISYITDNYASQMNVSLQVLFNNLDLQGGSSGSMAINEKNEVVGIYWGSYNYSNGAKLGAIDVFKNDINYYSGNNENIILKGYDTILDFTKHIKNTNISY